MDPEEIVTKTEAAYQSQDIDRIMDLFHPEILMYWNGRKQAEGLAAVRDVHEAMYADEMHEFEIRKSLRAASRDTIAVEWTTTWIDADGNRNGGYGGEFWLMDDGRLREWHAYHTSYVHDETEDRRPDDFLSLRGGTETDRQ